MIGRLRRILLSLAVVALVSCSGGGGGVSNTGCNGSCQGPEDRLEVADVQKVIAQAVAEAQARNAQATVAVVDRVGNVLGVFRMNGAKVGITVGLSALPGFEGKFGGGLEGITVVPDTIAAISKAITGAYLSSEGNAFTTRTASQIVQQFFNPGERNQPGGPLFGVQFSSLPCSDLNRRFDGTGTGGPQRSPLGLSADPGGFPLYKNGVLVGGVGAIADGNYTADPDIQDRDDSIDELVAIAGTFGFDPPDDRLADRITVDGKTFRYSDVGFSDLAARPEAAPGFDTLAAVGSLQVVRGYSNAATIRGTAFGFAGSGYRAAADLPVAGTAFAGLDAFVLVDAAEHERFAPRAGTDGGLVTQPLTANEVTQLLRGALGIANRARAQIRRPLDSQARVTVSVVDTFGSILGVARTRDAPIFGTDVSLQKARTAAFFSGTHAADDLLATPDTTYLASGQVQSIAGYVAPFRDAFGLSTLLADGSIAFGARSVGNLARPFFPDGIDGSLPGVLSKPIAQFSPFNDGFQLDLDNSAIVQHVTFVLGGGDDVAPGACTQMPDRFCEAHPGDAACTGPADARPFSVPPPSRLADGAQIFAGGVPVYRGGAIVGAIGISGDGIDQDDMIAFLGTHNAGLALDGAIANAPPAIRADQFAPGGVRLRYISCPQAPFLDSNEQRPCEGK